MRPCATLAFLAGFGVLGALGCSVDEGLSAVPQPAAPPTQTATPPADDPPKVNPQPSKKRVVLTENPFGGPLGNLLADGDFELSTVRPGGIPQLGWLGFDSSSERAVKTETGGICRTGLRCGVLESGMFLLAKGAAAPNDAEHLMTAWVAVPEGAECDLMTLYALDGNTFATIRRLKPVASGPVEGPWCRYEASFAGRDSAVYMYIDSNLAPGQLALIDSAVLAPNDGTVPSNAGSFEQPPAPQLQRLAFARKRIRDRLGASPRSGPPPWE